MSQSQTLETSWQKIKLERNVVLELDVMVEKSSKGLSTVGESFWNKTLELVHFLNSETCKLPEIPEM